MSMVIFNTDTGIKIYGENWPDLERKECRMIEIKAAERKPSAFSEMTDHELSDHLLKYSWNRSGEIAELTQAAGLRIQMLSRILNKADPGKDEW